MQRVLQDLRYGLRILARSPGFTAAAVFTLALGIGAATAIFSVIYNVLLDPFPYRDARRIVLIEIHDPGDSRPRSEFSVPEFLDYQEQNHVFDGVIGSWPEDVRYTSGQGAEHFEGLSLTSNTFAVLGVPALVGRGLAPDDGKPGAPPVFVMSYKVWRKRFHLDPAVLGRIFTLNGTPRTLVGIMPPRFALSGVDFWMPIALDRSDPRASKRYLLLQARLKPGVTLSQAEADIGVVAHGLARAYPKDYPRNFTVRIVTWLDYSVGGFRTTLYTLAAAVAMLLLIACSNVANLLLARSGPRAKELAIRASLGASRPALVRQLLIENMVLALGGAAGRCLLAYGGVRALVGLIPEGAIPGEAMIGLNAPVLLFSLGTAVFTVFLFGLAPALACARRDLAEPLKDSARGSGFRHGRLRNALVVSEVTLSLLPLAGAGLLLLTFVRLRQVDLGLKPENVLVAFLTFPPGEYKTPAAKQVFFRQLLRRVSALPGVVSAAEASNVPPFGGFTGEVDVPGSAHEEKWEALLELCSEGYFRTMGITLLGGRGFSEAEVDEARKVVVVNQTLVNKYFGKLDPIGRPIRLTMLETELETPVKNPTFEIVGVVADAKNQGLRDPPAPEVFVPYTVTGAFERGILARTSRDPLGMVNTVQREIWAADRNVALWFSDSVEGHLGSWVYAEPRFSFILLGVFAGVGLALVAIGVYGVIACTVSQQTREIGIRMALGARPKDILGMVLWIGIRLIGLGLILGLLASFAVAKVLANQLWGVSPHDPLTLCSVVTVVTLAGLIACYFPARRATKVEPMVALRFE